MPASIEINERDRRDYFAPTREVFEGFCKCCIERYDLGKDVVRYETVKNIAYDIDKELVEKIFTVQTSSGEYRARAVVLAPGAGKPNIPLPFSADDLQVGASHAMQLQSQGLLSTAVRSRIKTHQRTRVLVIGGGLTSAQLAINALKAGVSHVDLMMRGPMKSMSSLTPL